jgi:hypothetical protein
MLGIPSTTELHLSCPSSYKHTNHIGLEFTNVSSVYFYYLIKGPVSKYSHILSSWGLGLQH